MWQDVFMHTRLLLLILGAWWVAGPTGHAQDHLETSSDWFLEGINTPEITEQAAPDRPIIVAIVDDGVRTSHRDLQEFIWVNPSEIAGNRRDDDGNGFVDDLHGWDVSDNDPGVDPPRNRLSEYSHGTHLAGIIMQMARAMYGPRAPEFVRIMPVKALSDGADRPYIKDGYKGIEYAIGAGADIVLCAWGVGHIASEEERTLEKARDRGILVVASAGSFAEGREQFPAAHEAVIAVAALDPDGTKIGRSNFGSFVDLSAPGINITSTGATSDTAYDSRDGSSQAAAIVAGAGAIVRSHLPTYPPERVAACLKQSATNIEGANPRYRAKLGAGRLDLARAVECPLFAENAPLRIELVNPQGFLRIRPREKAATIWSIRVEGHVHGIRFTPRISEGRAGESDVTIFKEESGLTSIAERTRLSDFPESLFVPGSAAHVAVGTEGAGSDLDWLIEYRADPVDLSRLYCRDTVHLSEEGTIEDGSGIHEYTFENDCKWLITAPEGKVIRFNFTEMDTQPRVDQIYFFNGSGTHEDIMAIFSGTEIPPVLTTWSNQALVWFVTDGDVQGQGWKADYSFIAP